MKAFGSLLGFSLVCALGAQSVTDHPTLKSGNTRTGVNRDVVNSGPGYLRIETFLGGVRQPSSLRWFRPFTSRPALESLRLNETSPVQTLVDNSDVAGSVSNLDENGSNVGPYDPLPDGFVTQTGTWFTPTSQQDARLPYTVPVRRNQNPANAPAFQDRNFNSRYPSHVWARTTASQAGQGGDPRLAAVGSPSTFEWSLEPHTSVLNPATNTFTATLSLTPQSYGIFVWIPQGPVLDGATLVYPQRYFAYEIQYGNGQRYVDVVDTYAAGGGWVRLGNGGRRTNQVFPYTGTINPSTGRPYGIKVRLFNTIPRNSADELLETVTGAQPANRFAVYADAVMFSAENDSYVASPTSAGFGTADVRVTGAANERLIDPTTIPPVTATVNPGDTPLWQRKPVTVGNGVISSYDFNTGALRWRYSPLEDGPSTTTFDNTSPRVTQSGFSSSTTNSNFRGTDYLVTGASTALPLTVTASVSVSPDTDLADGSYEIFTYVAGDKTTAPTEAYAQQAQYEIFENGVSQGVFTIDLSGPAGWRRLGNRRYSHVGTGASPQPVEVFFYNTSTLAGDAGKNIYVDAVRFVGSSDTEITSTPVHTRALVRLSPGTDPVERNLVLVADERGRIHCLDAEGSADGTTTCYWTYPSQRSDTTDPNINLNLDTNDPAGQRFDGENGVRLAEMPTGFDLSTAVVTRLSVPGPSGNVDRDYLYIASTNGRIYSVAMEGRGDFTLATKTPGTTQRRWTYPETYPSSAPQETRLGRIASLAETEITISGTPTRVIIAATEQGRLYCFRAQGNYNDQVAAEDSLATTIVWQYPAANQTTLAPITGAPTIDVAGNRVFFGTDYDDETNRSRLVSLNLTTGALIWDTVTDATAGTVEQLDWRAGTAFVTAAELNSLPGSVLATSMPDTLFALNENGYVYAINANTGAVLWKNGELRAGSNSSIIYTNIRSFDNSGVLIDMPVIMVGTKSGRFVAMRARLDEETRFGGRIAWAYDVDNEIEASMTVSNRWVYGASKNGYLMAWSDNLNAGGFIPIDGPVGPGREVITDNNQDSSFEIFRNCEVAFLSREGFNNLRRTSAGGIQGLVPSTDVWDPGLPFNTPNGRLIAPYLSTRPDDAFEWGETIYLVAYNFPIALQNGRGQSVPPPVVELRLSTPGRPEVSFNAEAKLFSDKSTSDLDGGYAVFSVPLTSGGQTAQSPGPGAIRAQIRTSATNGNNVQQVITLNPALTNVAYRVANPIGISVGTGPTLASHDTRDTLGFTTVASDLEALMNGSQNVPGATKSQLSRGAGEIAHNTAKATEVYVFDRSLMSLLRGEGRGLDLVRVGRRDLRWQNGVANVQKPFAALPGSVASLFNHFEDTPTLFPNISIDYPDIRQERVRVRKDPNGNVENPVFGPVSLRGPWADANRTPITELTAPTRLIQPTVFELQVNVPKYQPSNFGGTVPDQRGNVSWFNGYVGRFTVYVDSDQNGQFGGDSREAYRSFNLGARVSPDEKIVVGTPTVDLGSLSSGAGYDTGLTYNTVRPYRVLSPTSLFNPDAPNYVRMFKPFTVFNEGNVNLLNVRVAKGTAELNGSFSGISNYWPWQIGSQTNNEQVWLDSSTDLHSDIDTRFAPQLGSSGLNFVVVQKPRVGDARGRQLRVNPSSRLNPFIPNSGQLLDPSVIGQSRNRDPLIAVTVPLGTPVGRYSQTIQVIEDFKAVSVPLENFDENLSIGYVASGVGTSIRPFESFSDPGFQLIFTVKETQLTGGTSDYVSLVGTPSTAVTSATPAQWNDIQPTGIRRQNGSVTIAYISNRPSLTPPAGNANPNSRNQNLFVGVINGQQLGAPDTSRAIDNPLRDLNRFTPAPGGRWVNYTGQILTTDIDPRMTNTLSDGSRIAGTVVPSETRLSHPMMPTAGDNIFGGFGPVPLVFVATTKRQTSNGLIDDSRLMMTFVDPAGNLTPPVSLDSNTEALKGRPTIVDDGVNIAVLYPEMSNGTSSIYYVNFSRFTGRWGTPVPVVLGKAFESVGSPSATLRNPNGIRVLELAFAGRQRGSQINEIFICRLGVDVSLNFNNTLVSYPNEQAFGNPLLFADEVMTYESKIGGFRSRGMRWERGFDILGGVDPENPTPIFADRNGATVSLNDPNVDATIDRKTGLISARTIFGGRAVIDSDLGTVKLTGGQLTKNLKLVLRSRSNVIRVSSSTNTGYSTPSLIADNRLAPSNTADEFTYWFEPSGAQSPPDSPNTFANRLFLTAVRSAAAGGQTSRPVYTTFRQGIRLRRALQVGEVIVVSGNTGRFQVDAAAGRIYFTEVDENRYITVQIQNASGGIIIPPRTYAVSLIGESVEQFVPIEGALNESNLFTFMDPFGDANLRRNMFWMLWSSTRNGSPNLYFQTMAPKIGPSLLR
jgi:hypothetical protein